MQGKKQALFTTVWRKRENKNTLEIRNYKDKKENCYFWGKKKSISRQSLILKVVASMHKSSFLPHLPGVYLQWEL